MTDFNSKVCDPQNPINRVRLVVGGQEYSGWKSGKIEAGIERQARSFDLSVTDKWPGSSDITRRIKPGELCQMYIGPDLVLTGFIDGTPIKYTGKSVSVGVRGRSKTADLVDCSPIDLPATTVAAKTKVDGGIGSSWVGHVKKLDGTGGGKAPAASSYVKAVTSKAVGQWRGQKLEVIAAALAAPYGVKVIAEVNTGDPLPNHHIQVGETAFESIDRMMRLRHVLSTDNEHGDLVFIDVGSGGTATTALETGRNIEEGDAALDYKEVFSEYIVKAQRAGTDDSFGSASNEIEGATLDESEVGSTASVGDRRATRRRVRVFKQSGQADEGNCQDRAEYERAHRAAKALQISYKINGWRQEDGTLWRPNMLVHVRDSIIGVDAQMVIAEIAYVIGSNGLYCDTKVGPPDGYRSKAAKIKKPKGAKKKGAMGAGKGSFTDLVK